MLIEKVENPYEVLYEGYHCFGCSKRNDKGLHLEFYRHGDRVFSSWEPDTDLQSYHNILHGGIQATMLDEVGAWWIYLVAGTAGFTSRLSVRYRKNVSVVDGALFLVASPIIRRRNIFSVNSRLFNNTLEVCAEAEIDYFTYPVEKAMRDLYFPGTDAFKSSVVESKDYGFPDKLFAELE